MRNSPLPYGERAKVKGDVTHTPSQTDSVPPDLSSIPVIMIQGWVEHIARNPTTKSSWKSNRFLSAFYARNNASGLCERCCDRSVHNRTDYTEVRRRRLITIIHHRFGGYPLCKSILCECSEISARIGSGEVNIFSCSSYKLPISCGPQSAPSYRVFACRKAGALSPTLPR